MDNDRSNKNNSNKNNGGTPSGGARKPPPEPDVICLLDDDDDDDYNNRSYLPQSYAPKRKKSPPPATSKTFAITIDDSSDEEGKEVKKKSGAVVGVTESPHRGAIYDLWRKADLRPSQDDSRPFPDSNVSSNKDIHEQKYGDNERKKAAVNPSLIQTAKKTAHVRNAPLTAGANSSEMKQSGIFAAHATAACMGKHKESASGQAGPKQQASSAVGSKRKRESLCDDDSDFEDDSLFTPQSMSQDSAFVPESTSQYAASVPESMGQRETSQPKRSPGRPKRQMKKKKTNSNQKHFPKLSDSLVKGARVLARFPMDTTIGDDYFWGEITDVLSLQKGKQNYSVKFDDGDVRKKVPSKEIMSEQTYYDQYGKLPPGKVELELSDQQEDPPMTPCELFRQRCNNCSMCRLENCGTCRSCIFNRTSTTTRRQECLLRVCERIEPSRKAQFVSTFRHIPFRVYFSTEAPKAKTCSSNLCFCQKNAELGGIYAGIVLPDKTQTTGCMRRAMKNVGYAEHQIRSYMPRIWREFTGYDLTHDVPDHQLVNKGVYYAWIGCHGQRRNVFGKIVSCQKNVHTGALSLQLEFVAPTVPGMFDCGAGRRIPATHSVDEATAWGGCLAFREKDPKRDPLPAKKPFYYKWITPDTRDVVEQDGVVQSIHLTVGGYRLELKAHPSRIPGAGHGLFLTCNWAPHSKKTSFTLPAGHLVDLGVYAPHLKGDFKSEALWAAKNLLFRSASECWGFDPAPNERLFRNVFDISDNVTGDVHPVAARSLFVYANETNGLAEVPSICMEYDPSGAVHYLLGYSNEDAGAFELPLEQEVELKVDYGPSYEQERVRKGYARVSGKELQEHVDNLAGEERDFVAGIGTYTANDLVECMEYLECIRRDHPSPDSLREQFLLLLLSFGERICTIFRQFEGLNLRDNRLCLNGYDERFHSATVPRFMKILHWNCFDLWKDDRSFDFSISQRPLLQVKAVIFLARPNTAEWSRPVLLQAVADMLHTPYNWKQT